MKFSTIVACLAAGLPASTFAQENKRDWDTPIKKHVENPGGAHDRARGPNYAAGPPTYNSTSTTTTTSCTESTSSTIPSVPSYSTTSISSSVESTTSTILSVPSYPATSQPITSSNITTSSSIFSASQSSITSTISPSLTAPFNTSSIQTYSSYSSHHRNATSSGVTTSYTNRPHYHNSSSTNTHHTKNHTAPHTYTIVVTSTNTVTQCPSTVSNCPVTDQTTTTTVVTATEYTTVLSYGSTSSSVAEYGTTNTRTSVSTIETTVFATQTSTVQGGGSGQSPAPYPIVTTIVVPSVTTVYYTLTITDICSAGGCTPYTPPAYTAPVVPTTTLYSTATSYITNTYTVTVPRITTYLSGSSTKTSSYGAVSTTTWVKSTTSICTITVIGSSTVTPSSNTNTESSSGWAFFTSYTFPSGYSMPTSFHASSSATTSCRTPSSGVWPTSSSTTASNSSSKSSSTIYPTSFPSVTATGFNVTSETGRAHTSTGGYWNSTWTGRPYSTGYSNSSETGRPHSTGFWNTSTPISAPTSTPCESTTTTATCTATPTPTPASACTRTLIPGCVPCEGQGEGPYCGLTLYSNYYNEWPYTCGLVQCRIELTNMTIAPDGVERIVLGINGQFPGPLIEANWGDTVEVEVINNLENNGTSMHFHGVRQWNTTEMDGVASITQCPVPGKGGSMTYRFIVPQYGHSWYHSHYSVQAWDGVQGPMVVHGPATAEFDIDLGPVMLTDWLHVTTFSIFDSVERTTQPTMDNVLINGKNIWGTDDSYVGERAEFTFVPGKKHRMQLIMGAIDSTFAFSIDGHTITVIATDWVPIVPYQTDVLKITIGQRYDIIVEANQPVSDYWMRVDPLTYSVDPGVVFGCGADNVMNGNTRAIVHYEGSCGTPETTAYDHDNTCNDEPYDSLIPWLSLNVGAEDSSIAEAVTLIQNQTTSIFRWYLSGSTFQVYYNQPTLLSIFENNSTYQGPLAVDLPTPNQWVYVIIETPVPLSHPIHLHGHDLFVLGSGNFSTYTDQPLNLVNPPRRDVVNMPTKGWIVIGFLTDNPGTWLLHCHIGWHLSMGFALQLVEQKDTILEQFTDDSQLTENCAAWNKYTQGVLVDQFDSGV